MSISKSKVLPSAESSAIYVIEFAASLGEVYSAPLITLDKPKKAP